MAESCGTCCNCSLETGTKFTALLQIGFSALCAYCANSLLILYHLENDDLHLGKDLTEDIAGPGELLLLFWYFLILSVLSFPLAILLFVGVCQRDFKKVKIWLWAAGLLLIVQGICGMAQLLGPDIGYGASNSQAINGFLFNVYCVLEVFCYFKLDLEVDNENLPIISA